MEKIVQKYSYEILHPNELSKEEQDDLLQAARARTNASAHISGFGVGARLRMNNGECEVGWNWENSVHTTLHAEKNAIGRLTPIARESGLKRVTVVGGMIGTDSEITVAPCGNCRQDLLELWKPGTEPMVIMAGVRGLVKRIKFEDLVPLLFDLNRFKSGK